jgi:uncharacterized protein YyaL (SSP411 family)
MSFEWNRMYKWEENHERNITEDVYEYVCEHYGIDEVEELNGDQLAEIEAFREELNDYSVMQIGFSNLINHIDTVLWEKENG